MVDPAKHQPGLVIHTGGWPLGTAQGRGGRFALGCATGHLGQQNGTFCHYEGIKGGTKNVMQKGTKHIAALKPEIFKMQLKCREVLSTPKHCE